jgi:NAD(P)H dehydrogenase (quinone)
MSIVVTAATGQLGSLVIDELLTRVPADQVVAVVRDAESRPVASS